MKKIIILTLAAIIAFSAIAEENEVNLYGKFRLDYDLAKSSTELDRPAYGGFNIDRARLGFKWTMSDDLKSKVEMDINSYELRIAEVTWSAAEAFDFSVGRMYEAYAPQSEEGGSRFDGISGAFDFGVAEFVLQVGNDKAAAPAGISIMPAVIITPDLGDISLETGINAQYITEYTKTSTDPDEAIDAASGANFYAILEVADLSALLNVDFNKLSESDKTNIYLNGDVNYTVSDVTLGASVYLTDLYSKVENDNMQTDLDFYVGSELTDGFKVKATMGLDNIAKSNNKEMDYKFTLRFEWNPKYDF